MSFVIFSYYISEFLKLLKSQIEVESDFDNLHITNVYQKRLRMHFLMEIFTKGDKIP